MQEEVEEDENTEAGGSAGTNPLSTGGCRRSSNTCSTDPQPQINRWPRPEIAAGTEVPEDAGKAGEVRLTTGGRRGSSGIPSTEPPSSASD